jgi:hypothetical protein
MCIDEQITNNLFIFIYIYRLYFTGNDNDEYRCSFDTDCNFLTAYSTNYVRWQRRSVSLF